jgi:LacI family transcriptional regulator
VKHHRVTVVDIALAAGVSKSTVSLVLQGSPLVHASTRERVNAAIADLGYVYNRGAANLRQARTRIIGVVVNDLTNSFFAELAVGIDAVVQERGFAQFLAHTGESLSRQGDVIAKMRENGVAGLIICPARETRARDLARLVQTGMPVVLAVRSLAQLEISTVTSENAAGSAAATRHLIGLGHSRIAFLGGFADTGVFCQRLGGYRQALQDSGLAFDPRLVVATMPSRAGGVAAFGRVMARQPRPTAAVCFNDAVAFGVCDAVRSAGMMPGVDFSVTGFDDVIEARSAHPALTTVSAGAHALGQAAAALLLRQIEKGVVEPETITLPVALISRQSSGRLEVPT